MKSQRRRHLGAVDCKEIKREKEFKTTWVEAHPFSFHPYNSGCWLSTDGDLQAKFVPCYNCDSVVGEVQAVQVHLWRVCKNKTRS